MDPKYYVNLQDLPLYSAYYGYFHMNLRMLINKMTFYPDPYHDLAILQLNASLKFNDYVQPAILHRQKDLPKFSVENPFLCNISGWGKMSANDTKSMSLSDFCFLISCP